MQPQTPGVYTIEKNAFPNSVVEVATAIPAFVGYTQQATYEGKDLKSFPTKVESFKQFQDYFGGAFRQTFDLKVNPNPQDPRASDAEKFAVLPSPFNFARNQVNAAYDLTPKDASLHYLYSAIHLFYLNGGSTCYIVSIGDYNATPDADSFTAGIDLLVFEQDPTMLLCPDALQLDQDGYHGVVQHMLMHCADVQSRVALVDVYRGAVTKPGNVDGRIAAFREGVGENNLSYGIAYFPWVRTSLLASTQVSFLNLTPDALITLRDLLNPDQAPDTGSTTPAASSAPKAYLVPVLPSKPGPQSIAAPMAQENILTQALKLLSDAAMDNAWVRDKAEVPKLLQDKRDAINYSLITLFPAYSLIMNTLVSYLNTLPVAPAIAGVYTATDNGRGVWKAPANVSLNSVVAPTVSLSDQGQADLSSNAVTGKSVNAIRSFKGLGTLVWGARTLDGNSKDWRFVNVRRTMIMIEQSVKLATRNFVFEPNDANTWTNVKSMISSFLFTLWKQGALAGAAPTDAYSVAVGLGSTMTADDILEGLLNVTVLVALVRPAEFIMITFQQQLQKS
jgi:phage tail sheath protein FI